MSPHRPKRTTRQRDRSAVLVEAAIVTPILAAILFGLLEVGIAWRADNEVSRGVRSAVLEQARNSDDRLADYRTLQTVVSSVHDNQTLEWIIIYRTSANNPQPPANCVAMAEALTGNHDGINNVCTVYSGNYAGFAAETDFDQPDCDGDPDEALCPADREALFATQDRLGLAVSVTHGWFTGFLPGDGVDIGDSAVSPLITGIGDVE